MLKVLIGIIGYFVIGTIVAIIAHRYDRYEYDDTILGLIAFTWILFMPFIVVPIIANIVDKILDKRK